MDNSLVQPKESFRTPIKRKPFKDFMNNFELLLLALPAIVFIFIFKYTTMAGVLIAFKNFKYNKGFWGSDWVGFRNFKFFFTSQDAWRVTRNTVGMNLVFIALGLITSVAIAIMLFEISRKILVRTYQTAMIFPNFISWVVAGYMFYAFFNVQYGIFNGFLDKLGLEPIHWYSKPEYWPFILAFASIWKGAGWGSVIYFASLVGIDPQYFEAAEIDGAKKLQIIRYITLPFLKPLMIILTILAIGGIFSADFGMFYNLARDIGPLYPTTDVIDTYVYRALRVNGDIGMSSAVGLYQSAVGFVLVFATNLIVRKISPENSLF